jgi:mono/diheme cytochrome c family protein
MKTTDHRLPILLGAAAIALVLLLPATSLPDDLFGWEEPARTVDPWARATSDKGEKLFVAWCSGCHGREGDGTGVAAPTMFPKPRDLTAGVFKFRTTRSGALPTRDDLLRTIRNGLPGTEMPSWGETLTERQLRDLVLFVESLSDRFELEERFDDDVLVDFESLAPPPLTPELLERGGEVYVEMKCASCHGEDGRGDGPAADQYDRRKGSDTEVFDFTWGVYKGGSTAPDLYRTFVTGLDGTPMPSYAASLPEEQDRWALAAFTLSLTRERGFGFYAGERPTWYEPATERAEKKAKSKTK